MMVNDHERFWLGPAEGVMVVEVISRAPFEAPAFRQEPRHQPVLAKFAENRDDPISDAMRHQA
jgi:hypothetical protein